MNTFHNENVLPFIAASEDINQDFDRIEREYTLERQLEAERTEHQRTRQQLQQQLETSQRISKERQLETILNNHAILPAARNNAVKLLALGDAGELELSSTGNLRPKYDVRDVNEMVSDWLKANPNFTASDAQSAPTPKLDRAKMTPKEKGLYIAEHGQEAYLRLPYSKPAVK